MQPMFYLEVINGIYEEDEQWTDCVILTLDIQTVN